LYKNVKRKISKLFPSISTASREIFTPNYSEIKIQKNLSLSKIYERQNSEDTHEK
jgi:hypothetical protein